MDMLWWHWVLLGLLLAGIELLTPGGFYVIFFGAGALLVGVLTLMGWSGPLWLQWLLFSGFSIAALALLRRPLVSRLRTAPERDPDALTGELAVPTADIAPGAVGRAELRGSTWSARNVGETTLTRGQRCLVERVDGLTLAIRAEGV